MPDLTFQREGVESNSQAGADFEAQAKRFFASQGLGLTSNFQVSVGANTLRKERRFDLGSHNPAVLVECKSHTWTRGDNSPSAKLTVWNEAMFYFHIAPSHFRKILFVQHDYSERRRITLGNYYLKNHAHLVPEGVEIWEYDLNTTCATRLNS